MWHIIIVLETLKERADVNDELVRALVLTAQVVRLLYRNARRLDLLFADAFSHTLLIENSNSCAILIYAANGVKIVKKDAHFFIEIAVNCRYHSVH